MVIACWSVKGGVGTSVVAAALAVACSRRRASGALVVDLGGDVPNALGLADPAGPGLAEWLSAGPAVPPDALARLAQEAAPGLHVLHRGAGPLVAERAVVLASLLEQDARAVIVDVGRIDDGAEAEVGRTLAAAAERSLLVLRPCQLAVRRAIRPPVEPTGVVVVREPGRALTVADVERVTGVAAVADLAVDPAVARAVDAGLLVARLPRSFVAALGRLA